MHGTLLHAASHLALHFKILAPSHASHLMVHCMQEGREQAWESLKQRTYLILQVKVVFASVNALILMRLDLPLHFVKLQQDLLCY